MSSNVHVQKSLQIADHFPGVLGQDCPYSVTHAHLGSIQGPSFVASESLALFGMLSLLHWPNAKTVFALMVPSLSIHAMMTYPDCKQKLVK